MSGWIREGTFIYKLNANGINEWIISVHKGKDDFGCPTSNDVVESVATMAHAAPDMYEALMLCYDYLDKGFGSASDANPYPVLAAAIAKARGERE